VTIDKAGPFNIDQLIARRANIRLVRREISATNRPVSYLRLAKKRYIEM
jgi:hypothetical protein